MFILGEGQFDRQCDPTDLEHFAEFAEYLWKTLVVYLKLVVKDTVVSYFRIFLFLNGF